MERPSAAAAPTGAKIIEVIAATRLSAEDFKASPLSQSLARVWGDPRLHLRIAYSNTHPLGAIYNSRIKAPDPADILIFLHDDVWIEDYHLADRVIAGLASFDIIGLAGSQRLTARRTMWSRTAAGEPLDLPHLAGSIAHGEAPLGKVGYFGPSVAECELLDGVFLAARKSTLVDNDVRFDPKLGFHLYDLDFCRTARSRGLRLGTWPIAVTHRSKGNFSSPQWKSAAELYLAKWGD